MKKLEYKLKESLVEIHTFAREANIKQGDIVSISEYGHGYMIWYYA